MQKNGAAADFRCGLPVHDILISTHVAYVKNNVVFFAACKLNFMSLMYTDSTRIALHLKLIFDPPTLSLSLGYT